MCIYIYIYILCIKYNVYIYLCIIYIIHICVCIMYVYVCMYVYVLYMYIYICESEILSDMYVFFVDTGMICSQPQRQKKMHSFGIGDCFLGGTCSDT